MTPKGKRGGQEGKNKKAGARETVAKALHKAEAVKTSLNKLNAAGRASPEAVTGTKENGSSEGGRQRAREKGVKSSKWQWRDSQSQN